MGLEKLCMPLPIHFEGPTAGFYTPPSFKKAPSSPRRSDREAHTPPPQNRRSASRVQNWGWCVFCLFLRSMPNMTGRPAYRTMGMKGGSSAPHLARTPCFTLFSTLFNRGGNRRAFRLPGAGGGSFPLYGGTFARSYLVSIRFQQFAHHPPQNTTR